MVASKSALLAVLAVSISTFIPGARAQSVDAANARGAAAASAENSVPRLVQFNGILKDGAARVVAGPASVTFAIYAEQEGGTAIWSETQNVLADANGHYSAVLGAATSGGFPAELFGTGESRWLGVAVARQAEMPRALLASVPYALKAGDAQTLGGLPASSYVTTQQLAARGVSAAPSTTIVGAGGAAAPSTLNASVAPTDGATAGSITQSVTQAAVTGTGTANYLPLWTSGSNLGVSKIYQANGGFVGINTNTPLLQLDVNGNSIFRGSFQMAPQGVATASAGQPSHSFQWQGSVYNSGTHAAQNEAFGFRTVPVAATNNTSAPTTTLDLFYGPGGGTLADTGLSISNTGLITFAPGQRLNASTLNISANGTNVRGAGADYGLFVSTGDSIGTYSVATGATGTGVYAYAASEGGIGVHTTGYEYGVLSYSVGDNSTSGYFSAPLSETSAGTGIYTEGYTGIYAKTYATNSYAGVFDGNVDVIGNLSKSGGSFKIDDPIDPAGKYLSHSFVESPDMKNVYDGVVTTDASGFATVTMPAWFEALNRDFRYQLTAMGQFSQAIIARKIANGQFTIQTDKPNVEVSWQITGIRQDAWANAHRIPVEQEKTAGEKGRYLHPELFGHKGDAAIGDRKRAAPPAQPK
jgi:hypothetical protein